MPFDFPNFPTDGMVITGPGGTRFEWTQAGNRWVVPQAYQWMTREDVQAMLGAPTSTGPAPGPSNPDNGDLWLNTDDNQLYVWDGSNWVPAAPPTTGFLPITGGVVTGSIKFGTGASPPIINDSGIASPYGNFNELRSAFGLITNYSGGNPVGVGWGGGNPGLGSSVYVNNVFNGYLVRSGAPNISDRTTIDLMGLNGAGPTVQWWYSAGSVVVAVTLSDRRLKDNLRPSGINAIELIDRLKLYETDQRNPMPGGTTQHWDCTLIADELDDVIPHARVKADEAEGSYDSINTYPLVCTLLKAVQELSARVAKLEGARG